MNTLNTIRKESDQITFLKCHQAMDQAILLPWKGKFVIMKGKLDLVLTFYYKDISGYLNNSD